MQAIHKPFMLPNLIIIGAMRAGTSSLHFYLDQHPQIKMSRVKELNFFLKDCDWPHTWHKGAHWYAKQFDGNFPVRGESSPAYSSFPWFDGVPSRMHEIIPDTKIIYLLRDPIARLVSDFRLLETLGFAGSDFAASVEPFEESGLVQRSRYFLQLEKYLEWFPASQIHIATLEDLKSNQRQTLREMFRFLNVEENFDSPNFDIVLNEGRAFDPPRTRIGRKLWQLYIVTILYRLPPPASSRMQKLFFGLDKDGRTKNKSRDKTALIDEDLRARLREYLEPDLEKLRAFCGRDFGEWKL